MTIANSEKITQIVFSAIDAVNELLPSGHRLSRSLSQPLTGPGAVLDSLGLVNLIAAIEQQLQEQLNVSIVLADERAMAQEQSPFTSIDTLINYINGVIAE